MTEAEWLNSVDPLSTLVSLYRGLNTPRNPPEERRFANRAAQKSGAVASEPELAALIAAWPNLTDPIKAGILAMVRAASGLRTLPTNLCFLGSRGWSFARPRGIIDSTIFLADLVLMSDDDATAAPLSNPVTGPEAVTSGPGRAPIVPQPITTTATSSEAGPDEQTQVRPSGLTVRVQPGGVPSIGGYELTREIARGGMGVVYAARDTSLDREVAVKVMLPGMSAVEFERESKITARLPHPGIPPVHALGVLPDGRPFLAMKLILGETLDNLLRSRSDPAEGLGRLLVVFERICQAVGFAHAQGIVHRDLKPTNVMVGAFGEVQVMDWGLAKAVGVADSEATAPDAGDAFSADAAATMAGQIKGTPAYMAPEQARGESVDARADVFALGGILAAILTGKPPFAGNSVLDTIIRAASADLGGVFGRLDGCGADPELIELAKRCLASRPGDRPLSGQEVAEAVAEYRAGVDARLRRAEQDQAADGAKAEEQKKRRRVQLILAGVVVAVLAGAGIATALVIEQRAADKLAAEQKQSEDRVEAEKKLSAERVAAEQKRQDDLRAADREAVAKQRRARADALVQALSTADTAGAARVIADLQEFHDLTGPELRELASRPVSEKPGLHARLALLVDEPRRAAELAAYLPECKPDELLPIRDALRPHSAAVAPGLWAILTDAKADSGKRVRAACALAGLTRDDPRWKSVAPAVAEAAVQANPVEFVAWSAALDPVCGLLVPELLKRYLALRADIESGKLEVSKLASEVSQYDLTANLLAQYTKDRPADLAELALTADPRHYTQFAGALNTNKPGAVPVLKAEMAKPVIADWKDAPPKPEWVPVDPATVKRVEAADGLLHERFALVQSLPLPEFEALANALSRSGYRPVKVRPYDAGAALMVAAVWRRDGAAWKFLAGATANEVHAKDDELRTLEFQPADVAGWVDPDAKPRPIEPFTAVGGGAGGFAAASTPALRFAAVWEAAPGGKPVNRIYLGREGTAGHREGFAASQKAKLWPRAVQALGVPGVGTWFSGVWGDAPEGSNLVWYMTSATYLAGPPNRAAADFTFSPDSSGVQKYAAVWHGGLAVDVEQPTRLSVAEQLAKAKELAAAGWRPVALGVAGSRLTASVWHRPTVPDAAREAQGKRRGYAAAVLLTLGEADSVWPVFAFPKDGDPTARSYLLERLAAIGADPLTLVKRFGVEEDVSAKRALLIALRDFPAEVVPAGGEREPFVSRLLVLYRDDPDSGLHGAIDCLLRQKWGKGKELAAIDAELARAARAKVLARALADVGSMPARVGPFLPAPAPPEKRDWFVNGEGQTYAVVRGPVEFVLGSPLSEPGRIEGSEQLHRKRISRTFAIATKETTVEQFLRFSPKHSWYKHYSSGPDTPAVSVTWYECAAYCNWLSAREGIPPDQWCYEPNEKGEYAEGMRMKVGHLKLTGYRLPTEAEWEFACRSGAATVRHFGRGAELLPRYGWYAKNSEDHAWPVGGLRPNELGLFDSLGNAYEWCEDPNFNYTTSEREDVANTKNLLVDERLGRIIRGGSFGSLYSVDLRCAFRLGSGPSSRGYSGGFRPVRTLLG